MRPALRGLLLGRFEAGMAASAQTADGLIDTTFDGSGVALTSVAKAGKIAAPVVQDEGTVLFCGAGEIHATDASNTIVAVITAARRVSVEPDAVIPRAA